MEPVARYGTNYVKLAITEFRPFRIDPLMAERGLVLPLKSAMPQLATRPIKKLKYGENE